MPGIITLLLIAAVVCFAIPAIRAILDKRFDYTNSGLFCLTLTVLLSGAF